MITAISFIKKSQFSNWLLPPLADPITLLRGFVFLMLLVFTYSSYAQSIKNDFESKVPDSLWISSNKSTYLAFPQEVDLVNIGSADFIFQVEKNIVFLKAQKIGVKSTNMLVKCGYRLFSITLMYQAKPKKCLYDLRNINFDFMHSPKDDQTLIKDPTETKKPNFKTLNNEDPLKNINKDSPSVIKIKNSIGAINDQNNDSSTLEFERHALTLLSMPDRFKTYGVSQNQITLLFTDIYTDSTRMYLKFKFINRSSLAYDFDYISFHFKRKTHFTKNTIIAPIWKSTLTSCNPHSQQSMVFVLPLFGTSDEGEFSSIFREFNGVRKETIQIPDRAFKLAKTFN